MITAENLSIGYRRGGRCRAVVSGINANVPKGALACLVGANGAGKSTLLRTLCGFQPPIEGRIIIAGRSIADYRPDELARLVSVVLTDRPDARNTTAAELVAAGRSPYTDFWGRLSAADKTVVRRAMEQVGIASLADRKVHTLSDGERQKVMIAKALAQETPVIFLDEPTAFLDYPGKADIMRLLRSLATDSGKTILLSTHDLEQAAPSADFLWLMRRDGAVTVAPPSHWQLDGTRDRFLRMFG